VTTVITDILGTGSSLSLESLSKLHSLRDDQHKVRKRRIEKEGPGVMYFLIFELRSSRSLTAWRRLNTSTTFVLSFTVFIATFVLRVELCTNKVLDNQKVQSFSTSDNTQLHA
jgi:hypothetical protein